MRNFWMLISLVLSATTLPVFSAEDAAKPAETAPAAKAGPLDLSDLEAVIATLRKLYVDPAVLGDRELHEAAAQGILAHLASGAKLIDAKKVAEPATPAAAIAKTEMIGDQIDYIRLGKLDDSSGKAVDAVLAAQTVEKLNGIILDLRFVQGNDFAAAADLAGRFLPKETFLFALKGTTVPERKFTTTFEKGWTTTPLIILVNHETAGGAEALAAALNQHQRAVIIGTVTAGDAVERSQVALTDGRTLSLAVAQIVLADDRKIFPKGIEPHVPVKADLEVERKLLQGAEAQKDLRASLEPKASKHRFSEADLVRALAPDDNKSSESKKAEEPEKEGAAASAKVEQPADVALSRALDLLKGLRILRRN